MHNQDVIKVCRKKDRIMWIKMASSGVILNVTRGYTLQVEANEALKRKFWVDCMK